LIIPLSLAEAFYGFAHWHAAALKPRGSKSRAGLRSPKLRTFGPLLNAIRREILLVSARLSTDGAFLTYSNLSGMFGDLDGNRAHDLNERLRVSSVYKAAAPCMRS
jgi:hypothetical protein